MFVELDKLLVGEFVFKALTIAPQVIFEVIPELKKCYNFNQHSKWHSLDVYNHIARAVSSIKPKQELRWCMLFHDVAKPDKFFLDENGEGHFYGHADLSEKVAYGILKRLKASNKLIENVCFLVKNHDKPFPQNDLKFKLRLAEIGEKNALDLVDVKYADNMAQGTIKSSEERQNIAKLESKIKEVIKTCDCINIKQLKVDGNDVVAYGFKGRQVGDVLQKLFVDVLAGNIKNEREKLLKSIEKRAKARL